MYIVCCCEPSFPGKSGLKWKVCMYKWMTNLFLNICNSAGIQFTFPSAGLISLCTHTGDSGDGLCGAEWAYYELVVGTIWISLLKTASYKIEVVTPGHSGYRVTLGEAFIVSTSDFFFFSVVTVGLLLCLWLPHFSWECARILEH